MKSIKQIFSSRQMFILLLMGFSSGLPISLTGGLLQAWMASEGVELKKIAFFSLVGFPYTVKFLWSPFMDRFAPAFLGRRRGWMLICQLALIVSIVVLGFANPKESPLYVAVLAFLVTFLSASQDIVVDAYRPEVLPREEYGAGASVAILGYNLGMITSGAFALMLSDYVSWSFVYALMASLLLIGVIATFLATEPEHPESAPKNIQDAVVEPLKEYFQRPAALQILAFVVLYKLGDVLAAALSTPFMMEIGFSRTEIGATNKALGLFAITAGGVVGGGYILKLGLKRSLWNFGILQAVSILTFAWLAVVGKDSLVMAIAIALEKFCSGLGNAAFIAFLMSLCNKRFTASQYALLTSLGAISRVLVGAPTGYLVGWLGWVWFYVFCAFASIPGMLLVYFYYDSWVSTEEK